MSFIQASFPNLRQRIDQLLRLPQRHSGEIARVLREESEQIATASKERFAPVDTGALRGSIHATPPEISPLGVETSVVAGGAAAPYAAIVHEDMTDPNINWNVPGTGPKYIEIPFNERLPTIERRANRAIDQANRKGFR